MEFTSQYEVRNTRAAMLSNSRRLLNERTEKLQKRAAKLGEIRNLKARRIEQVECQQELEAIRESERILSSVAKRALAECREVR